MFNSFERIKECIKMGSEFWQWLCLSEICSLEDVVTECINTTLNDTDICNTSTVIPY